MQHSSTVAPSAGREIMGSAGREIRLAAKANHAGDAHATAEGVRELMQNPDLLEAWAVRWDPDFKREHLEFPGALEALAVAMLASGK